MKRFLFACFVAFWSSVVSIWGYAVLATDIAADSVTGMANQRFISAEELARHASSDDCWMAIEGVVYNFTAYLPQHPTPPVVMTDWCGKDATQQYRTKGYGRPHSPAADALLPQYQVGMLKNP